MGIEPTSKGVASLCLSHSATPRRNWLRRRDSNPKRESQSLACCQLHQTPVKLATAVGFEPTPARVKALCATSYTTPQQKIVSSFLRQKLDRIGWTGRIRTSNAQGFNLPFYHWNYCPLKSRRYRSRRNPLFSISPGPRSRRAYFSGP